MRKFYYSLLMLLMGITTAAFAQQQEASDIQQWDGSSKKIEMERGDMLTFEYTSAENGMFYLYASDQSVYDNVPLSIWGGWYHDGAYDADAPLNDAGTYENGVGLYGWLKVWAGDVVRFTISALADAEGELTEFTLKSAFFNESMGGNNWENPIVLSKGTKVTLPVYANADTDVLPDLVNTTFCSFVAPTSGVASIFTEEYLVYYIEADLYGVEEFKHVSQNVKTNDHEFIVENGKTYIVVIPNSRPTEVTFKMTQEGLGASAQFPNPIKAFPATLDLKKGNNYYAFGHDLIGDKNMLEVAVAAGWNGTITYMEDPSENSAELSANTVAGQAATFVKNVDTRYLYGSEIIVNFKVSDVSAIAEAVTLTLREPKAGESFGTATPAVLGENAINGPAGDYWFVYTSEMDAVYNFATSGELKHVNFTVGVEQLVADNVYRVDAGETIYVCVTTTTETATFTIVGNEIVDGDYCDRPVYFNLGDVISIAGRGVDNYHSFTAEDNGFALFSSTNWSVQFRQECGGRRLNPEETITESGDDIIYSYKLPVTKGQNYIVEVTAVSEDITITSKFEAAAEGEIYATAIEIKNLGDTIKLPYEFEKARWYKVTSPQTGYLTAYAKLGYAANMTTKLGDAAEVNAGSDNGKNNAYMGGYKAAKVYVEEGETLYIYTKTGRENDEEQFGANFYLVVSFVEARPGEDAAIAIEAEANTDYVVMAKGDEAYNQWYIYTIPANEGVTISILSTVLNYSSLTLYNEDLTTMSSYKDDFVQTTVKDGDVIVGKTYEMSISEVDRTIYIYTPIATSTAPVIWKIENTNEAGIVVEEIADETPVIYDLMGRRVEVPTKGIYIINGVKRIIK